MNSAHFEIKAWTKILIQQQCLDNILKYILQQGEWHHYISEASLSSFYFWLYKLFICNIGATVCVIRRKNTYFVN